MTRLMMSFLVSAALMTNVLAARKYKPEGEEEAKKSLKEELAKNFKLAKPNTAMPEQMSELGTVLTVKIDGLQGDPVPNFSPTENFFYKGQLSLKKPLDGELGKAGGFAKGLGKSVGGAFHKGALRDATLSSGEKVYAYRFEIQSDSVDFTTVSVLTKAKVGENGPVNQQAHYLFKIRFMFPSGVVSLTPGDVMEVMAQVFEGLPTPAAPKQTPPTDLTTQVNPPATAGAPLNAKPAPAIVQQVTITPVQPTQSVSFVGMQYNDVKDILGSPAKSATVGDVTIYFHDVPGSATQIRVFVGKNGSVTAVK